ncbi:MAG: NAD(P)/FAD-dependent oxidoreductase [Planctomycetota bacterium]
MNSAFKAKTYDAIVIGGGAAGVGIAIALKDAGLENFLVLERYQIGSSFDSWPAETRLITPSFPSNSVGMLDLNSIAIGVSPAFSMKVEHPTGKEYAAHLRGVAAFFHLPIRENTHVIRINKIGDDFVIDTPDETLRAKHVIWAAGEFQFPQLGGFTGSELCRHTATIASYEQLEGDNFLIIGGCESGVDAAYYLSTRGKRSRLFDRGAPWDTESSEPSGALSTYSHERMREESFQQFVELMPESAIESVDQVDGEYQVTTDDGRWFRSEAAPILAGGFEVGHKLVDDLFEKRDDGYALLNEHDESTITPGLFLSGPAVRHDGHIFCFIYKYRQRFAVVAKAIATSLDMPAEYLEQYRKWGMYLDDLSCCGQECVC